MQKQNASVSPKILTSKKFVEKLKSFGNKSEKLGSDSYLNTNMRDIFSLAKDYMNMPVKEIEKLLESQIYEARVGAASIMDWKARNKKTNDAERKNLFELYIKRHDRINSWGMVDRAAPYVVGGYLFDKSRDILFKLARSKNLWERRSAIVSTYFFIRQNDLKDTFKIAQLLVQDTEDLVQKAVGGWIREAGKRDIKSLLAFLDKYAASMPRTMLRYAIEHLSKKQKVYYMSLKKQRIRNELH